MNFPDVRPLSDTAKNILQKRYFQEGEKTWKQLVDRVVDNILDEATQEDKETTRQIGWIMKDDKWWADYADKLEWYQKEDGYWIQRYKN